MGQLDNKSMLNLNNIGPKEDDIPQVADEEFILIDILRHRTGATTELADAKLKHQLTPKK